jgi:glyceraldehyde 3-phosphate dehydrogenase
MATRIGINGFGRIGRQVTRAIMERHGKALEVVAVNDLADAKTNAHLFKYDTNYGVYPGSVSARDSSVVIDGHAIRVFSEREPGVIPWGEAGAEIVIESTGRFTDAAKARAHLTGSVKKVIISAPARGEDLTVVLGVNERLYDRARHTVISNASCTTNCFAPMVKVLNDSFGVRYGLMTTVHSYTNDQRILDQVHEDLRRARAAAMNIIPTTTGAAKAISLVIPDLKGKFDGYSLRVPTPTVSVVDFTAQVETPTTTDELRQAFRDAAATRRMKGILAAVDEPLVSIDFKGDPHSASIDLPFTSVLGKDKSDFLKVVAWYDNEWGYSVRVADLANFIAKKGL